MSRSRLDLDQVFYNMIEGRIIGSLKTCERRRIYVASTKEAASELLNMFHKKRDLGIGARDHIEEVLRSSTRVIVEEEGAIITVRLPTRREAQLRRRKFNRQPRRRIDSRQTRERRFATAAG